MKTKIAKWAKALLVIAGVITLSVVSTCCVTAPNGVQQRGYPPQQMMAAPEMGPMTGNGGGVRVVVGEFVPSSYFRNQPPDPTGGCERILYAQAFGEEGGYWANDFRTGRAQIQPVPQGQMVFFDRPNGWAWKDGGGKVNCRNRVKPVGTRRGPPQPMPQPRMMQPPPQQRRANWGEVSRPVIRVAEICIQRAVMRPPQRCPQPQQLWCPPQQRGYGYQPYPQPYPPRYY